MPFSEYEVATAAKLRMEVGFDTTRQDRRHNACSESECTTSTSTPSGTNLSSDGDLTSLLAAFPSTPPSVPKRSDSARSTRPGDIYFSPVDSEDRETTLSSPLPSPLRTPTQESFGTAQVVREASQLSQTRANECQSKKKRKFLLTSEQHDELVDALVSSPMLQDQICRSQRTSADEPTLESSTHEALKEVSESPTVGLRTDDLRRRFAESFPDHASTHRPPRAVLLGMAIFDPKLIGSPVRYSSKCFKFNVDVQNPNAGLKHPGVCFVRFEGVKGTTDIDPSRVVFQIREPIVRRGSGTTAYALVAEVDVTEHFSQAALVELLELAESTCSEKVPDDVFISKAKDFITYLTPETCTMESLKLMSTLNGIRKQYINFFCLRTPALHENGVPKRIAIPFMSQHLRDCASEMEQKVMQNIMISIVGKKAVQGDAFTTVAVWPGHEMRVKGVQLFRENGELESAMWICFTRDVLETDIWHMAEG